MKEKGGLGSRYWREDVEVFRYKSVQVLIRPVDCPGKEVRSRRLTA